MNEDIESDTISFTFTEEVLFVPPGYSAKLDDGREIKGPVFLIGEVDIR